MGRTNVVVDDELIELVMRGCGWAGDLNEIRRPMVIEEWG